MRVLWGILLIWGAVLTTLVVLLLLTAEEDGDDGALESVPPLSCSALGERAQKCRRELVKEAGDFVEKASLAAGRSPVAAGGRHLLVTGALDNAIRRGEVQTHCEAQRASPSSLFLRLWPELERCWPRPGCASFVACLRKIADTEQAAGTLPL